MHRGQGEDGSSAGKIGPAELQLPGARPTLALIPGSQFHIPGHSPASPHTAGPSVSPHKSRCQSPQRRTEEIRCHQTQRFCGKTRQLPRPGQLGVRMPGQGLPSQTGQIGFGCRTRGPGGGLAHPQPLNPSPHSRDSKATTLGAGVCAEVGRQHLGWPKRHQCCQVWTLPKPQKEKKRRAGEC